MTIEESENEFKKKYGERCPDGRKHKICSGEYDPAVMIDGGVRDKPNFYCNKCGATYWLPLELR